MSCKECGRPSPSALCSGCRTLGRIDTLWRDLDEKDLSLGLGFLRECAGALTDLAEARWAERQTRVPLKSGETPPVTGEAPGSAGTGGGEAAPKEKPVEEKGPAREPLKEVKEEALASDRGEGEPEESYSYETGEEEPAAEEKAEPKSVDRTKSHPNAHKIQKGNLSKPLGLRPLPVKLSRRDPEPEEARHDDGERGRERKVEEEEESERRRARGGDASGWKDGVVMQLSEVPLDEMTPGLHLVLMDASYYRSKCNVSGKVKSIEAAGADRYLFLVLTGTTNKDMLKVSTAKPDEAFKVHLCIRGCGEDEVGDFVIHAQKGRVVQDMALEEEWLLNLESVKGPAGHDELALLREREKRPDAPKEKDKEKVDSSSSSTRSRRKKKKKAKKKEAKKVKKRKKEDDVDDKPDKSKEEDPKKADGRSPMVDSTKPLETLFGGTGLDPRERVRRRVVRKARAYLKKRGNEKSSGSSILGGNERGTLAGDGIGGPRASAMLYARQQLAKRATGPVLREILNLSTALDHIVKGNPSRAADVLCQRLKSLELILGGSHWSVAQRLECTSQDSPTISTQTELKTAQKETYEEVRMRQLAAHPGPRLDDRPKGGKGKNKDQEKGDRKGRGKGDAKDGGKADKEKKEVCSQGARHFVDNIDLYIKPRDQWGKIPRPKVMVSDGEWSQVCQGLVACGLCCILPREEVFDSGDGPLLNGMFGVTKDEWVGDTEVYRLIMNLIPFNLISEPLSGDVATLPTWSSMTPLFLQPTECLLVSSEDVRCFFYTMSVPGDWVKYLAFNKMVPDEVLPEAYKGRECYLASLVLPMGYLNSVSLAQHVHRNLALASGKRFFPEVNTPEGELRKDLPFPDCDPRWRIYLDNYDLLERVEATRVLSLEGSEAPGVTALKEEYDRWQVMGHISVESNAAASRVVESHFPGVEVVTDVKLVDDAMVHRSLFEVHFPWCQVHSLMESVASLDDLDRDIMSADFGSAPWQCDAGQLTWCSRPRLYWVTWELLSQPGASVNAGEEGQPSLVQLASDQDLVEVCKSGWLKVDETRPFPTFTTARPSSKPGRKPAGILQCDPDDISRWQGDSHKFPPYQYTRKNCLINRKNELRVPDVEEREYMLGFPVGYTRSMCRINALLLVGTTKQWISSWFFYATILSLFPLSVIYLILWCVIIWSIFGMKAVAVGLPMILWQVCKTSIPRSKDVCRERGGSRAPLPESVLQAMAGWAFFHNHVSFGISLLIGFYGMLRTGEILSLKRRNLSSHESQEKVLISLGLTKSGKRAGAAESTVLGYDKAVKPVKKWMSLAQPSSQLAKNPGHWRKLFNEALSALRLT
eukprot:symbB.v1.2.026425.t1/scaffold2637.1/size74321/1